MKKNLFLIAALFIAMNINAQQTSFSLKGGLSSSNFIGSDVENTKAVIGFHAGVGADFEFLPSMAIQTGLIFTTKGAKDDENKVGMMYVQLPLHFAYKVNVTPGTRVVLHGGPYAAFGVAGKTKAFGHSVNTFGKTTIEGIEFDGAKRFDAGFGIGAGAEFGAFLIDLTVDTGIIQPLEGLKANNISAFLSVGMRF